MRSTLSYAATVAVAAAAYPSLMRLGLPVPSVWWTIGFAVLGVAQAVLLGALVASTAAIRPRDLAERIGLPRIPFAVRRSALITAIVHAFVLAGAVTLAVIWCGDALLGSAVFFLLPTPILLGAELWRMHREATTPAGRQNRDRLAQFYDYLDVTLLTRDRSELAGNSALGAAAMAGDDQTVRALLATGAAPDQLCQFGFTALMLAIIHHRDATALLLIESGADVGKASAIGSTPLMAAVGTKSKAVVEALLAKGAAIDAPQQVQQMGSGRTALMVAAMAGDVEMVRVLLAHGADPTTVDRSGRSVIDLAGDQSRTEILALLLRSAGSAVKTTGLGDGSATDEATATADQLTVDDAKHVERRLAAMPAEERTERLINGIVQAGLPFVNTVTRFAKLAGNQGLLQEHADECRAIMIHWLMGTRLTDRADEDERRLVLCMSFIEQIKQTREFDRASIPLLHMASNCILRLPERHPRRDTALALRLLVDMVNWCNANNEAELLVSASTDFLRAVTQVQDQATLGGILALAARAEAALSEVEEIALRRRFRSALGFYLVSLAMAARDAQQPEAQVQWIAKATAQLDQLRALQPTDADEAVDLLTMEAVIGELRDDAAAAADAYARIRGIVGSSAAATFPALQEGRLRLKLQEDQAVVDAIQPVLAEFKEAYLLAVETSTVQSAGRAFTDAVSHLAFAQARLGDWDAAIRTADQAKSLRLRHRAAMRATPEGQRLLGLEAALYALSRGLPPDLSSYRGNDFPDLLRNDISREALFREEYRRAKPALAPELVASPSTQEIAAVLHDDEAVVMLGTSFAGTFLAVMFADDRAQPGAHLVLDDWPSHRLWEIGGTPKTGWMYVLAAPQGYKGLDHRQALALLIERIDQAIGSRLAALLRGRNVSRLTMIMSGWLHTVPWWAMPSLAGYRISVAPSAAQLVLGRRNPRALARKTVGAADPTLDLPLSLAEVEAMAHHLAPAGFEVATCSRARATEEKILALALDAGILHFSGHGRSDFFAPSRSALLLYPDLGQFARFGADPLAGLSAQVSVWNASPFEGRFADLQEIGRLYETGFPEAQALERFLEYGARGTLWARYERGQMTQMAELWRTGDILVAGAMNRCGLAVLSACESGGSGLEPDIDEPLGLPAALQLAGVSTVIATLWPVTDVVAVLFADLFYAKLAHSAGMVDLTAVVADIADRLRGFTREEAASLLDDLGRRTGDAKARFRLKAAARLILAGDETRPYGDPIAWASFYVSGSGDLHLDHLGTDGENGHMAVSQEQSAQG